MAAPRKTRVQIFKTPQALVEAVRTEIRSQLAGPGLLVAPKIRSSCLTLWALDSKQCK